MIKFFESFRSLISGMSSITGITLLAPAKPCCTTMFKVARDLTG